MKFPEAPEATLPRLMLMDEPDTVTSSASAASVFETPFILILLATYVVCRGAEAVKSVLVEVPSPLFEY